MQFRPQGKSGKTQFRFQAKKIKTEIGNLELRLKIKAERCNSGLSKKSKWEDATQAPAKNQSGKMQFRFQGEGGGSKMEIGNLEFRLKN